MKFKLWLEDQSSPELEALVAALRAEYPQLEELWAWETPNSVEVGQIGVKPGERRQGIGTAVMKRLQTYATKVGKPIVLRPEPERGKKAALQRFYKNLGFVNNRGRHKDYSLSNPFAPSMFWRPPKEDRE